MYHTSSMKRLLLFSAVFVVAVISGILVFNWSGKNLSRPSLENRGNQLENRVRQEVKEHLPDVNINLPQIPTPQKTEQPPSPPPLTSPVPQSPPSPTQPTNPALSQPPRKPTPAPTAPPKKIAPAGPPQEEVNHKDKEKLEELLGQ